MGSSSKGRGWYRSCKLDANGARVEQIAEKKTGVRRLLRNEPSTIASTGDSRLHT